MRSSKDNRTGIFETIKFNISQPFFTAKPKEQGRVEQRGTLTAESTESIGLEFIITWPNISSMLIINTLKQIEKVVPLLSQTMTEQLSLYLSKGSLKSTQKVDLFKYGTGREN